MQTTHNVFYELRPVPPDGLHRLEDVHLTVLDHLLDAGVRSAVNADAGLAVTARNSNLKLLYVWEID